MALSDEELRRAKREDAEYFEAMWWRNLAKNIEDEWNGVFGDEDEDDEE